MRRLRDTRKLGATERKSVKLTVIFNVCRVTRHRQANGVIINYNRVGLMDVLRTSVSSSSAVSSSCQQSTTQPHSFNLRYLGNTALRMRSSGGTGFGLVIQPLKQLYFQHVLSSQSHSQVEIGLFANVFVVHETRCPLKTQSRLRELVWWLSETIWFASNWVSVAADLNSACVRFKYSDPSFIAVNGDQNHPR